MTLRERVRGAWLALTSKTGKYPPAGLVPDVPDWRIGMFWSLTEVQLTHPEAYKSISTVRAVIDRIANDCAAAPKRFYTGEGAKKREIERVPGNIVDVWQKGNLRDSGIQVVRDLYANREIHGTAYLYLERGKNAPPSRLPYALWTMPSHLIEVVEGESRIPERYLWLRGGARESIRRENMIQFRVFNPFDEPIGSSWLDSVQDDIAAIYWLRQSMKEHWRHGGMRPGFFKLDRDYTGKLPTEPEIRAMQEKFERLNQSPKGASRVHLFPGLEPMPNNGSTKDLDLASANALLDANIARARGVPPWMLGIKETGALGQVSAEADLVVYIENTLKPVTDDIDAVLNEQFCPLYGKGISVETDYSGMAAMQASLLKKMEALQKAAGRACFTVNELRPLADFEPHEDPEADELFTAPPPGLPGEEGEPGEGPPQAKPPARKDGEAKPSRNARLDLTRERMAKIAAADLMRYVKRTRAAFVSLFTDQELAMVAEVAERFGAKAEGTRLALDVDEFFDEDAEAELRAKLQRIFADLIETRGEAAAAQIGLEVTVDATSPKWQAWVGQQVDRAITNVDGTTREMLRERLAEAVGRQIDEGGPASLSELTEIVRDVFDQRRGNALTIARTETLPAYNAAAIDSWREGGIEQFEWLSARDDSVRDTHAEADGQVRPDGEAFDVGGARLLYPGDPSGPPEETINCRCTLLPVIPSGFTKAAGSWWGSVQAREHTNGNGKPHNRIAALLGGAK